MNQTIIIFIISIIVAAFLVRNHFKQQEISFKMLVPGLILAFVFLCLTMKYPSFKADAAGLILRFLLGLAIGVLQGHLAKVFQADDRIVSAGTKVGLAFWLIFIPVRLWILPWFSTIASGHHNLEDPSLLGVSALFIFAGFFLSKGITLFIRKSKLAAV